MSLLLAIVLAVPQTTWIVDANNGPGTNFTDLPPAVTAAASGDTIFVRNSLPTYLFYSPFSVSGKALTIRGEGASNSRMDLSNCLGSSIANVPSGSLFCVEGLEIQGLNLSASTLVATSCTLLSVVAQQSTITASNCSFRGVLCFRGTPNGQDGETSIQLASNSTLVATA